MKVTNKTVGILLIIFVMIVWGSAFAVTKMAVQEVPPYLFAFIRFAIATLTLLLYMWASGRRLERLSRRSLLQSAFMGLAGVTLYYAFFNMSLRTFPASLGALVQGFIPACITLLTVIFLKERLNLRQICGVFLSVAGVTALGWGGLRSGNAPLSGLFLMVLSVVAWSTYTIMSKKITHLDAFTVTFFTTLSGSIFLVPFVLTEIPEIHLAAISAGSWCAMFYLGVLGSALCYFLYNRALESLSATQVSNFMNLDPIVGSAIAILLLGETLSPLQITGALLVFFGITLSSFRDRRQAE